MNIPDFHLRLPPWLIEALPADAPVLTDSEAQMRFVIDLGLHNVREATGGPFAAAIFDAQGRLLAPGVNLVIREHCSILHAEMVAIMLAQKSMASHSLDLGEQGCCTLVSLAEPCAMCLGAIPWAGLGHLIVGARDEDVRRVGFDEGCKPQPWTLAMTRSGITVERDILRQEAAAVLVEYLSRGGRIY